MSRPPFEIIWAWDLWAWSIGGLSNKQRYRLDRGCYMIARENMDMRRQQMVGETYLERGNPVVVLARWGKGGGPRNVLIQREDGTRVIRPFRGLRKADWNVTDDYASPRTADRGEEATRLRRSRPLAGVLSEAERRSALNRFYESARV